MKTLSPETIAHLEYVQNLIDAVPEPPDTTDWGDLVNQAKGCVPAPLFSALCRNGYRTQHHAVLEWLETVKTLSHKRGDRNNPLRPAVKEWNRHRAQSAYAVLMHVLKTAKRRGHIVMNVMDDQSRPIKIFQCTCNDPRSHTGARIIPFKAPHGDRPQDIAKLALSRLFNCSVDRAMDIKHPDRHRKPPP